MIDDIAALLRCPLPSAALHLERITTANGVPVEYCNSIVRGDRCVSETERKKKDLTGTGIPGTIDT